jgi:hypothetical protein
VIIYGTLLAQADLLAFVDIFRFFALLCLICAPLALLFKNSGRRGAAPMMH